MNVVGDDQSTIDLRRCRRRRRRRMWMLLCISGNDVQSLTPYCLESEELWVCNECMYSTVFDNLNSMCIVFRIVEYSETF